MNIDSKKLKEIMDYLDNINSVDLSGITVDGNNFQEMGISEEDVEEFKYTGLTNIFFLELHGIGGIENRFGSRG